MRVYDVSITLGPDAPIWEDETGPVLETIEDMAKGAHATVTRFSMGSHNGTHVDAPAHFVRVAPPSNSCRPRRWWARPLSWSTPDPATSPPPTSRRSA
jgi:kynurenine formamidase